jgi:biotin operon repressor
MALDTVNQRLISELDLSEEEAKTYVEALRAGRLLSIGRSKVMEDLVAKGMMIRSSDNKGYIPLHPRLAVSNQFRTYQEKMIRQMKEKRLAVDKLTLELIRLYEGTGNQKVFPKNKDR